MSTYRAKAAPVAATYTTLGVAPSDMTINIRAVNHDLSNPVAIRLAISDAAVAPAAPADTDWIEPKDLVIPAGGVLEETAIRVLAGEAVTVYNSAATVTWRMHGV